MATLKLSNEISNQLCILAIDNDLNITKSEPFAIEVRIYACHKRSIELYQE